MEISVMWDRELVLVGDGVHFVAGANGVGKTLFKRAIAWCLTGEDKPAPCQRVEIADNGVIIVRRAEDKKSEGCTKDGESIPFKEAIARMGFDEKANVYRYDEAQVLAACRFTDAAIVDGKIKLDNGKVVDLAAVSIEKCEAAYRELLAERETVSHMVKGVAEEREKLVSEIEGRKAGLREMRKKAAALKDLLNEQVFLELMKKSECPLYNCSCPVEASTRELSIEDRNAAIKRAQAAISGGSDLPDLTAAGGDVDRFECLKSKLNDLDGAVSKEERAVLTFSIKLDLLGGMNLVDRLQEIGKRVSDGKRLLEAARAHRKAKSGAIYVNSTVLAEKAANLGLKISVENGTVGVNGKSLDKASRGELVLAAFAVQEALGLSMICIDNVDALDSKNLGRLVKYAVEAAPARNIIFLGRSCEKPRKAKGVTSWYLNGSLERV